MPVAGFGSLFGETRDRPAMLTRRFTLPSVVRSIPPGALLFVERRRSGKMSGMNRLSIAWSTLVALWKTRQAIAAELVKNKRKLREARSRLKQTEHDHAVTDEDRSDQLLLVGELKNDIAARDIEIGRLQNEVDLLRTSLEYQLLWREQECERMKAEAAIQIRRRMEAVSSRDTNLFESMED